MFPSSRVSSGIIEAVITLTTPTEAIGRHRLCQDSLDSQRAIQQNLLSQRLACTCGWIFTRPEYQHWLSPEGPDCLWLAGLAGAGKSVLSAIIADDLERQSRPACHFFLPQSLGLTSASQFVLKTLRCYLGVREDEVICQDLLDHVGYTEKEDSSSPSLSFQHHLTCILAKIDTNAEVYLIFDGFDREEQIKKVILQEILHINKSRSRSNVIKCFFSSRTSQVPTMYRSKVATINMCHDVNVRQDVRKFAEHKLAQTLPYDPLKLHLSLATLADYLCTRGEATFLWVDIVTVNLVPAKAVPDLLDVINSLPSDLNSAYRAILSAALIRDARIARTVFTWLIAACRPLSLTELVEAMVLEYTTPNTSAQLEVDSCILEKGLANICGPLIMITMDRMVEFRHSSVRDFLTSKSEQQILRIGFRGAHELCGHMCLKVLTSKLEDGPNLLCASASAGYSRLASNGHSSPLQDYAAVYWSIHYRLGEPSSKLLPGELQSSFNLTLAHVCKGYVSSRQWRSNSMEDTALRLCCFFGFSSLAKMYLEMGVSADGNGCSWCEPPVHIAAIAGHSDIVALLLQNGASISSKSYFNGKTALHHAAAFGSTDVIQLLLEHGATVDALDSDLGMSPLHFAARSGNATAIESLMRYGANYNAAATTTGETPLHLAASHGNQEVAAQLLQGGLITAEAMHLYDSIVQQSYYRSWSAEILSGHSEYGKFTWELDTRYLAERDMQALLSCTKNFADLNATDLEGRTPLHAAAFHGQKTIVKLLLEHGAHTWTQDNSGCTAMDLAILHGHLGVIRLLLVVGNNNMEGTKCWGQNLEEAADRGHETAANLMLWQSFSTEIGGTPSQWPILCLATQSKQNTVREIIRKKRSKAGRLKKGTTKELPMRDLSM